MIVTTKVCRKISLALVLGIVGLVSLSSVKANDSQELGFFEELREFSRDQYVEEYNRNVLQGIDNAIIINSRNQLRNVDTDYITYSTSSESFRIVGGNKKQTVKFYGITPTFGGYFFKLNNSSSSQTDVNFAIYELNSNGTLGSKVGGWYNDVHAGNSRAEKVLPSSAGSKNFAVIIENDGYFWESNIEVSGTIQGGF